MDTRTNVATTELDSPYAWARLAAAVGLGTVGGVGMWSMPVVLPAVQAEFAIARGDASLPFTLSMFGFALRRRRDGPPAGPPRHRRRGGARHRSDDGGIRRRFDGAGPVVVRVGVGVDRVRHLRHIRPADGRRVVLVYEAARHRRRHRGSGQLSRRHYLAAARAALHRPRRLARDLFRHRRLLPRPDGGAVA